MIPRSSSSFEASARSRGLPLPITKRAQPIRPDGDALGSIRRLRASARAWLAARIFPLGASSGKRRGASAGRLGRGATPNVPLGRESGPKVEPLGTTEQARRPSATVRRRTGEHPPCSPVALTRTPSSIRRIGRPVEPRALPKTGHPAQSSTLLGNGNGTFRPGPSKQSDWRWLVTDVAVDLKGGWQQRSGNHWRSQWTYHPTRIGVCVANGDGLFGGCAEETESDALADWASGPIGKAEGGALWGIYREFHSSVLHGAVCSHCSPDPHRPRDGRGFSVVR